MNIDKHEKAWVVQKCLDAEKNQWEDFPGYSATPMTYDDVMEALKVCDANWPYEFRGHRVIN